MELSSIYTRNGKMMNQTRKKKSKVEMLSRKSLSARSRMLLLASAFTASQVRLVIREMRMTSTSLALVSALTLIYHCTTQDLEKQMRTEFKVINEDKLKNRDKLMTQ